MRGEKGGLGEPYLEHMNGHGRQGHVRGGKIHLANLQKRSCGGLSTGLPG